MGFYFADMEEEEEFDFQAYFFFHPVERAGRARCKKHSMRKRWNEGHRRRLSDLPPSAESSF